MRFVFEHPVLLPLLIPLLGAGLIAWCGRWPNLRESVTLITAAALFASVFSVLTAVRDGPVATIALMQPLPGVSIAFNSEPLSVLFALIASGLWIVTSVYAIGYMRGNGEGQQTRFYVCFALALWGAMGVAFAANLFTLFIFYEVLTLSTFPLVAHHGTEKARAGARTYLGVLMLTSILFFLPAMLWVYVQTGTLDFVAGGIMDGKVPVGQGSVLLVLFIFGIAKAAVMPFHRWLPAAMVAPTPVSALLHAVAVVKAGVFTVLKLVLYLFGTDYLAQLAAVDWVLALASFTIIAASVVALFQTNLKRLLAYSTIAQLSYVVLAALILAPSSQLGAALHIAAHAVSKITLFFAAGAIYVAAHKTEIPQLNGIARQMPITMVAFAIGALSMIGVPPTAGFVSKWFILAGAYQAQLWLVWWVLLVSTLLNAAYFLPVLYRAFLMPAPAAHDDGHAVGGHSDAPWPMRLALLITSGMTLLLFFFHAPLLALLAELPGGHP